MNVNKEIEAHWKKNGDKIKFKSKETASYDMIRGSLTRYAYGRLKSWQDAEDAVQEAYLHAVTYPPKGEGHNFGGLYKIWLDQAIFNIRAKNHKRGMVEEEEDIDNESSGIENTESSELIPEQAIDISGQTNLIMDMTDGLKHKPKSIIRLALIFGYEYKEIEKILKVSPKTVDNTLTYFRQKVKEHPKYENLCRGS
jgi:RNA polymerase sigma factor (sigma-70 family)